MIKTKCLPSGKTQTVESFWNATGTAFFRAPAGATINVKYGKGRWSVNRQKQVLDGETIKKLTVGKGSILLARMRVSVPKTADVTYDVYPGNVAITTPEQRF
ncbi:hypothetical protein [Streptosporangium roseum]|uniref:hypothetical protein n=1 Tax=Streptosporangium roseum TaxID=2001 RepID=UPI0033341B26